MELLCVLFAVGGVVPAAAPVLYAEMPRPGGGRTADGAVADCGGAKKLTSLAAMAGMVPRRMGGDALCLAGGVWVLLTRKNTQMRCRCWLHTGQCVILGAWRGVYRLLFVRQPIAAIFDG